MAVEASGYQKLSRDKAIRMLSRVRLAYPTHPFQETGYEGVYSRRLPFFRRYLDYVVRFVPVGSWGFYASDDDLVVQRMPGQEPAEFVVSHRDPLQLDEGTALAYLHHLCLKDPRYIHHRDAFLVLADIPEIHRAMIQSYARPPRFAQVTSDGVYWGYVTLYTEESQAEKLCSTLSERCLGVTPDGQLVEGEERILVHDLRAHRVRRR